MVTTVNIDNRIYGLFQIYGPDAPKICNQIFRTNIPRFSASYNFENIFSCHQEGLDVTVLRFTKDQGVLESKKVLSDT